VGVAVFVFWLVGGERKRLSLPTNVGEIQVIESVEAEDTEWGISLSGYNPKPEDYFALKDEDTAFRLKERLTEPSPLASDRPGVCNGCGKGLVRLPKRKKNDDTITVIDNKINSSPVLHCIAGLVRILFK